MKVFVPGAAGASVAGSRWPTWRLGFAKGLDE